MGDSGTQNESPEAIKMGLAVRHLGSGCRTGSMERQRFGRSQHVCSWRLAMRSGEEGRRKEGGSKGDLWVVLFPVLRIRQTCFLEQLL